jgi:hypothetical protein
LLNTENTNAYKTVTLQDLNDPNTALKAISTFSIKKDLNNVSYIDYAGGATRVLQTTSVNIPKPISLNFISI